MSDLWVVILAGGEGMRLQSLTRALYGVDLPKQFAVLVGARSLLQLTVERAERLASRERILVVVSTHREQLAREQLAPYPGVEIVVQPKNLDTGPGLLLPLARIRARDPHASVAFLPSDHFLSDAEPLLEALRPAKLRARGTSTQLSLIGVRATHPEVEYGWIVPGRRLGRTRSFAVSRFVEKPQEAHAQQLFSNGALWNTFIHRGPLATYWNLARIHLPVHAAAFETYTSAVGTAHESRTLDAIYAAMPAANFSRDLLAQATELTTIPLAGTGWTDWGSPKRVFESLAGSSHLEQLLERIRRPRAEPALAVGV